MGFWRLEGFWWGREFQAGWNVLGGVERSWWSEVLLAGGVVGSRWGWRVSGGNEKILVRV